ncbi:MAG: hypothetical protein IT249_03620 [Chitinophagaceae bacterium]|nr:hypothetical protein [Chitinophagaceae bacterium]
MKSVLVTLFVTGSFAATAQNVGINTNTPEATLQIVGVPATTTVADGVILPSLTGDQLKAKDAVYTTAKTGAIVYVTAAASPTTTKTVNVTTAGFYYFNGSAWQPLSAGSTVGDVKTGLQTADHNGWVKLDGRALSSLTTSQQARATSIGLSGSLPNASNAVPLQNGSTLGSINGDMSKTIAQNQLPNVTFNGTTGSGGDHNHGMKYVPEGTGGFPVAAINAFKQINSSRVDENDIATTDRTTNAAYQNTGIVQNGGSHTHTFTTSSLNGNVTQQTFDVTPKSLSVNIFIYLGL